MKVLPSASLGVAALAAVLLGAPAHAIPSSFVSETGSGTACTRTAPCATFQAAHNAADAGGEISCIDDGNFASGGADGLTITKSVTIDCVGTVASLSGFTDTGILINTAGVVVRVRNVTIDGTGAFVGINFLQGAALFVESCIIKNMNAGPSATGIAFTPTSAAKLFVSESLSSAAPRWLSTSARFRAAAPAPFLIACASRTRRNGAWAGRKRCPSFTFDSELAGICAASTYRPVEQIQSRSTAVR